MQNWDAAAEAIAIGAEEREVDLRQPKDAAGRQLSWDDVRRMLDAGAGAGHKDADPDRVVGKAAVLRDYSLDDLDPTQRAFADRVLKWADKVVQTYQQNKRARPGQKLKRRHCCGASWLALPARGSRRRCAPSCSTSG